MITGAGVIARGCHKKGGVIYRGGMPTALVCDACSDKSSMLWLNRFLNDWAP